MKTKIILFAISLIISSGNSAENEFIPTKTDISHSTWNLYKQDLSFIMGNTLVPKTYKPWHVMGYTGITMFAMLTNDAEIHEDYGLEQEFEPFGIPKLLGNIGTLYDKPGPEYFAAALLGSFYGSGKLFKNTKLVETSKLMIRSLVLSSLINSAGKIIIGRARPYKYDDPHYFRILNYDMNADYMSMPSGHTSSIFAMMTVIAKQYNSWYIKFPAYTFAVSVAFQRMNDQKHWSSDVIVGGTIGYLIGSTIVKRYRLRGKLIPSVSPSQVGVIVQL